MTPAAIFELAQLRRNQWTDPAALERGQVAQLRALIRHAERHVPYYRCLLSDAGVHADDIRTLADLARIPVTPRHVLGRLPAGDITADNVPLHRCIRTRTTGSLGMPITIHYRPADRTRLDLVWARAKLENGQRLSDRVVTLREPGYTAPRQWFQRLGVWRKFNLSCHDSRTPLPGELHRLRPDVLMAPPSSLLLLAAQARDGGPLPRPRLVFTTAELLSDQTRRLIEEAFLAPVIDCYGASETGLIAWQCPHRAGYHINTDSTIVEFVREGRPVPPGESGSVVCTVLRSFAMPFIRYALGDMGIAAAQPCPCGRTLPLMRVVEGREVDFITLPDGRQLSPFVLTCAVEQVPAIRRYQVVQTQRDAVTLRVEGAVDAGAARDVTARLGTVLGPAVRVAVRERESLTPPPGGKFRIVVSAATATASREATTAA